MRTPVKWVRLQEDYIIGGKVIRGPNLKIGFPFGPKEEVWRRVYGEVQKKSWRRVLLEKVLGENVTQQEGN